MTPADPAVLAIDIVSDVVCPWCYIGMRRLGIALTELGRAEPELQLRMRWHPFQLNPDLPQEGVERRSYLEAKFGGPERAAEIYARVRAAGDSVGIAFDFDRIAVQPNTCDAHRLIGWAQAHADANPLVERLFRAYFLEGRDIGDRVVLAELAAEAGFDGEAATAFLASEVGRAEIEAADRRAREMGIGGVPFFVFDEHVAVSGAQTPDVLLAAIGQARAAPAA
jgi:predicted DsbA family dithiol-disulfide isomerase